MLDYNILSMKPDITIVKDNEYVRCKDLTAKVYNGLPYSKGSFVVVEEYYVARPDLISLAMYGTDKYGDVICKVNGISNPFELNKGMLLFVPDVDSLGKIYKANANTNDVLEKDNETIDKKKKRLQKYKNERRTPGEQTVADKNYIIDKTLGIVIY